MIYSKNIFQIILTKNKKSVAFLFYLCYIIGAQKVQHIYALVAQLDRVTGYEPVGRGFESLLAHQSFSILTKENPQDIKNVDFPQQVSLSILAEHI